MLTSVPAIFRRLALPAEIDDVVELLCGNEWPFHGNPRLVPSDVEGIDLLTSDVDSYWITEAGSPVGLIRLLDLGDVEHGSPLFDIRIAASHRGRGLGTAGVRWLTNHLFERFEVLHRIEATTRIDNLAMRRVLERCGYRLEGQLREAWLSSDGSRTDTMIYGIVRSEWADR
jgi:RimJ/RimL family protein N-acetyltransferase